MLYKGSCHCGAIAFEIEGEIEAAISCNCSICARKGALLWSVPRAQVNLRNSAADIGTYTFNSHTIAHRFCRVCGMQPYAEDAGDGPERSAYINLRCVENIDLAAIPVMEFDGRSM